VSFFVWTYEQTDVVRQCTNSVNYIIIMSDNEQIIKWYVKCMCGVIKMFRAKIFFIVTTFVG